MRRDISSDTTTEIRVETGALTPKTKFKTTLGAAFLAGGLVVSATLWCANVSAELAAIKNEVATLKSLVAPLYEPARPAHASINKQESNP